MRTINLKLFCDDDTRPAISQPFSVGDFTYSTNGRIMIRVPRRDDVPEVPGAPDITPVWKQFPQGEVRWSPLPEWEKPTLVDCSECRGAGRHECSCGHHHLCENCDGAGERMRHAGRDIGGRWINTRYLEKLATLPNVEVALDFTKKVSPMAFRFEGGCGLVMAQSEP